MSFKRLAIFLTVAFLLTAPTSLLAQRTTATFAGIVTDKTGAVLPSAEVSLTNEGTGASTQKISNETGEFIFDFVPVGTYTLKIVMPRFKTFESRSIPLGAAQNVRKTYTLEVGSVDQEVMVTGEAPLVNTDRKSTRLNSSHIPLSRMPMINPNIS